MNRGRFALLAASVPLFCRMGLSSTLCHDKESGKPEKLNELYPAIKAYKEGFLQVSDLHSIYYGLYGNPKGKPVVFFHGGPGGGTTPSKRLAKVCAFVLTLF
jgi:hypothetical protein